jgi:hypothetical protein
MLGLSFGVIVEGAVAILLATTIGYCVILNQKLKRLHADREAKITSLARNSQPLEEKLAEPNKVQSALSQLAMRPRIRGNAA